MVKCGNSRRMFTPLLGRLVRCSAHGRSFVRVWYMKSCMNYQLTITHASKILFNSSSSRCCLKVGKDTHIKPRVKLLAQVDGSNLLCYIIPGNCTCHLLTAYLLIFEPVHAGINHMKWKAGPDDMQSHPLCRIHFCQYQVSSGVLGRPRRWVMHKNVVRWLATWQWIRCDLTLPQSF